MPRTIDASDFEAKCLELIDEVERTRELILVTRDGKPYVELRPHKPAKLSRRRTRAPLSSRS